MKVRKGFVTNSSSSSFIVTLDKPPKSQDELKEMLFYGLEAVGCYDYAFTTETVSAVIWDDLRIQKPNDWESILNEFLCDSEMFGGVDSWEKCRHLMDNRDEYFECLNKCYAINDDAAKQEFEQFKKVNQNSYTYIFEYGDHYDLGAVLEHGNVFRSVPYIRVNKH